MRNGEANSEEKEQSHEDQEQCEGGQLQLWSLKPCIGSTPPPDDPEGRIRFRESGPCRFGSNSRLARYDF